MKRGLLRTGLFVIAGVWGPSCTAMAGSLAEDFVPASTLAKDRPSLLLAAEGTGSPQAITAWTFYFAAGSSRKKPVSVRVAGKEAGIIKAESPQRDSALSFNLQDDPADIDAALDTACRLAREQKINFDAVHAILARPGRLHPPQWRIDLLEKGHRRETVLIHALFGAPVQSATGPARPSLSERLATQAFTERLHELGLNRTGSLAVMKILDADRWTMRHPNTPLVLATATGEQRQFLEVMIPEALRLQNRDRIPASATIAMAIYESAYGQSELASGHYNFFGIKAFPTAWQGARAYLKTVDDGVPTMAYFRSYSDFITGMDGFAGFLRHSPRYQDAFSHPQGDLFVAEILKAGYCPDKDYLDNIRQLMQRHRLTMLDKASSGLH